MKTLHLKNDLGISKAAIKKSYLNQIEYLPKEEQTERGFDAVGDLLKKRGSEYTPEECRTLVHCYLNSHDYCVLDNTGFGEFSAVEEYQANEKYERMENALEIIKTHTDENV